MVQQSVLRFKLEIKRRLEQLDEFFGRETNVFDDFAQKIRRDVSACVKWNGGNATIRVPELLVRSALADLCKAELREDADNFARL